MTRDWLRPQAHTSVRALNADIRAWIVLTQERAIAIAAAVLRFNRNHPQRPVHVLADDSDIGSNHSPAATH